MKARISFKQFEKVEVGSDKQGFAVFDEEAKTALFDIEIMREDPSSTVIVATFDKGGHYPPLRLPVDESFNLDRVKGLAMSFSSTVGHAVNEPDVTVVGTPPEA
jgi:hypothetical protein